MKFVLTREELGSIKMKCQDKDTCSHCPMQQLEMISSETCKHDSLWVDHILNNLYEDKKNSANS